MSSDGAARGGKEGKERKKKNIEHRISQNDQNQNDLKQLDCHLSLLDAACSYSK